MYYITCNPCTRSVLLSFEKVTFLPTRSCPLRTKIVRVISILCRFSMRCAFTRCRILQAAYLLFLSVTSYECLLFLFLNARRRLLRTLAVVICLEIFMSNIITRFLLHWARLICTDNLSVLFTYCCVRFVSLSEISGDKSYSLLKPRLL